MKAPGKLLSCVMVMITASLFSAISLAEKADKAEFKTAFQAAKHSQQQVAKLGFEWTTVAPLLKGATAQANSGNFEKAITLAKEAKRHSDLGITQAADQAKQWQSAVVR